MDGREQRGLEIAATKKIRRMKNLWFVPSSNNSALYEVRLEGETKPCTCLDFETRQITCKHIHAVTFTLQRETRPDGSVLETRSVRVTYGQNWTAYNAAQTHEKERVTELLRGLCDGIVQPAQKRGRPRLALSDLVFSTTMKVYGLTSGRRAATDIRDCKTKGHIDHVPHYNSIGNALESPALTPILKSLIEESASPLSGVESDFAIDSSGFSTCTFVRWFDHKYGKMHTDRQWLKCHLMIGVKTHVVTSVEITGKEGSDFNQLPPLVESTAKRFDMAEVSADKGYISNKSFEAITAVGATPYIPFKSNTTGEGPELWRKMFHFYQFNRTEFLEKYHKRSNVESTFSMIKAKFGASVRSKKRVAQVNEILCKVLCHNLSVLVHSIYELGLEPTFWAEGALAQQVA